METWVQGVGAESNSARLQLLTFWVIHSNMCSGMFHGSWEPREDPLNPLRQGKDYILHSCSMEMVKVLCWGLKWIRQERTQWTWTWTGLVIPATCMCVQQHACARTHTFPSSVHWRAQKQIPQNNEHTQMLVTVLKEKEPWLPEEMASFKAGVESKISIAYCSKRGVRVLQPHASLKVILLEKSGQASKITW